MPELHNYDQYIHTSELQTAPREAFFSWLIKVLERLSKNLAIYIHNLNLHRYKFNDNT